MLVVALSFLFLCHKNENRQENQNDTTVFSINVLGEAIFVIVIRIFKDKLNYYYNCMADTLINWIRIWRTKKWARCNSLKLEHSKHYALIFICINSSVNSFVATVKLCNEIRIICFVNNNQIVSIYFYYYLNRIYFYKGNAKEKKNKFESDSFERDNSIIWNMNGREWKYSFQKRINVLKLKHLLHAIGSEKQYCFPQKKKQFFR